MTGVRRLLLALLAIGLVGSVSTVASFAAFSSTTSSPGNSFAAGTVAISDNDAGAAMLSLTNAQPGSSDTGCIALTYSGSLDATVRLYGTVSGGLASYVTMTVTRGTDSAPAFDSCAAFTPDSANYIGAGPGVIYSGALSGFPSSYATGIVDPTSGSPETWTTSEAHAYRFTVTLSNDNAAQGLSATAAFSWEAQNN